MSWQLLIAISIVLEACGRIIQRVMMRGEKSDPIASALLYQFFAGMIFTVAAFVVGFQLPNLQPLYLNLLLTPVFWGTMNMLVFKSLQTLEASVFTILFASRTLLIIILSILILNESFSVIQAVGAVLILAAVVIVSWQKQTVSLRKGELFALLGAVVIALGIVNDSYIISQNVPVLPYLAYEFLASGIFIALINPSAVKRVFMVGKTKKVIKSAVLLAFVFAGAAGTGTFAYQVGNNAAQLGAIYPVSNILVVLLAIVLLKERSHLFAKLIAVILSVIGIILISL